MISSHKNKDKGSEQKTKLDSEGTPRQFLVIIITPEIFLKVACTGKDEGNPTRHFKVRFQRKSNLFWFLRYVKVSYVDVASVRYIKRVGGR
jgi:hypothetical protein